MIGEEKSLYEQINTTWHRNGGKSTRMAAWGHHARMILALAPTAPADWTQTTSFSSSPPMGGSAQSICVEDDTDLISLLREREKGRKEVVGRSAPKERERERGRACQGQLLLRARGSLDIVRPTVSSSPLSFSQ